MRTISRNEGQSTLEFAILIGVIVLCFVAMSNYVKYAASGRLKSSADSISQTLFNPNSGTTSLLIDRDTRDASYTDGSTSSTTLNNQDRTVRTDTLPP